MSVSDSGYFYLCFAGVTVIGQTLKKALDAVFTFHYRSKGVFNLTHILKITVGCRSIADGRNISNSMFNSHIIIWLNPVQC